MNYFLKKLQFLLLLLLFIIKIIKVSTLNKEFRDGKPQCIGKHQIPLENIFDFGLEGEIKESIALKYFNITPIETILENNCKTIAINMKYDTSVPTVNLGTSAGLSTYRFEFLYFQWYENATSNHLPFELHAVFYDLKAKNFQNALKRKNNIIILAFGLKTKPQTKVKYAVLQKHLKSVRTGLRKVSIENRPLRVWLPASMKEYILYEGNFPFLNCEAQVLWVDFASEISLEPQLLKEFELLQTVGGQILMKQYKTFVAPSGSLWINHGISQTEDDYSMYGIPLVDAYNDDDDENVKFITFNGAIQSGKVSILIIFFECFITFF